MILEVRMNFSDRLKGLRIDRGLTVRELASIFDVSPSTISNYEQEYRRPDFETLGKFADYFDVSTDRETFHRTLSAVLGFHRGSPTGRPVVDCTDSQNPMTSQNAPD